MKFSLSSIALGFANLILTLNPAGASPVEAISDTLITARSGLGFGGQASSPLPGFGVGARDVEDTSRMAKREPPVGQLSAWMNNTQCLGTPARTWTNSTIGQCLTHSPNGTPVGINRLRWVGNFCAVFLYNSDNCLGPIGIPTFKVVC
ncbi:hypothetical protein B0T16DRAFT_463150 [Cercophora newfieldiana]|uniref:Uncharacterized protein n=1 Tax=Cercophora newfieldiana TaxID=92897 RepID=A0AA39XSL6_9PEZI|nr:hypothetical protein B0T16DRAFT_463150 [Cercophora newfieldiana]